MKRQLFSPSWHSVAELRPKLLPTTSVERHVYRGRVWYVVQDSSGGRFHRMTAPSYQLLSKMDGSKTVQTLWEEGNELAQGDACTQGEIVDLLVQLHAADLLSVNLSPDSAALFARFKKKRWDKIKQYVLNPMSLKFPLVDPDAFIRWSLPGFSWLFNGLGALIWMAVVVPAAVLAGLNWSALTDNLSDQLLSSSNLLVMAFVFPLVKLVHELGHGYAARSWGAPVREMGLMFLVFAPVPYVNASATSIFPSKFRRAVVAASGMLAELFLAGIAMYVWLLSEPGIVRAVAYNVLIVAGVSTLVINGNPLLRYDGYYIFSDLIEMPNLAQRGTRYLTYLWDRYVYRSEDAEAPDETPSERRWLVAYTPLAWMYRITVTVSIILFVANKFFIIGVLMAIWSAVTMIGTPVWKAFRHVTRAPQLERVRTFALRVALGGTLVAGILLFVVPAPLRTTAIGVVWLPEQAILRAESPGFFESWNISVGHEVKTGDVVFRANNPELMAELKVANARRQEAEGAYRVEQFTNPSRAANALRQLEEARETVNRLSQRVSGLEAQAETQGVLASFRSGDMEGAYLRKGELVAYVLDQKQLIARVAITQDDIDLLRGRYRSAHLRLSDSPEIGYPTEMVREPVSGVGELPSAALSLANGGSIPTRPDDPDRLKTLDRIFLVDLALPEDAKPAGFGERVFVRFDLGWEPLGWQAVRRLRQLFLGRFGV